MRLVSTCVCREKKWEQHVNKTCMQRMNSNVAFVSCVWSSDPWCTFSKRWSPARSATVSSSCITSAFNRGFRHTSANEADLSQRARKAGENGELDVIRLFTLQEFSVMKLPHTAPRFTKLCSSEAPVCIDRTKRKNDSLLIFKTEDGKLHLDTPSRLETVHLTRNKEATKRKETKQQ